jgi:hypothetical protein
MAAAERERAVPRLPTRALDAANPEAYEGDECRRIPKTTVFDDHVKVVERYFKLMPDAIV